MYMYMSRHGTVNVHAHVEQNNLTISGPVANTSLYEKGKTNVFGHKSQTQKVNSLCHEGQGYGVKHTCQTN